MTYKHKHRAAEVQVAPPERIAVKGLTQEKQACEPPLHTRAYRSVPFHLP